MSHNSHSFNSQYTKANLASDAVPYDSDISGGIVKYLQATAGGSIRGVAPQIVLFHDITTNFKNEETKSLFYSFKHAINLTWAFIGLPRCIPVCLGLVHEMRKRGIAVNSDIDREFYQDRVYKKPTGSIKGKKPTLVHRLIYRAVGNSEVGKLMAEYFPGISYVANAAVFGFLIEGSVNVQSLPLSEIVVASAIAGMDATRQARSHFKAAMGLGISKIATEAVIEGVYKVATWNGTTLPGKIDVSSLAEEVRRNLQALGDL